jgi:hypothetical protein
MKMNKAQRELMADLGKRGGIARGKRMTPEEKRLHSQKMNQARRSLAAKALHDAMDDAMVSTTKNEPDTTGS